MKPSLHNCKAHRATLIQPVVHLRRPDMQGWDGWLHVNPFGFGASEDTLVVVLLRWAPRYR